MAEDNDRLKKPIHEQGVYDFGSRPHPRVVSQVVPPLRLIFWGGLLCSLDIYYSQRSGGMGFRCDILNDVVGTAMVALGVYRLALLPVDNRYDKTMTFVLLVALSGIVKAVFDVFIFPLPSGAAVFFALYDWLTLAAVLLFCAAMRWLCQKLYLDQSEESWRTTFILYVYLSALPLGILNLLMIAKTFQGGSYRFNTGWIVLLLAALSIVPLIHLFVSTSRMGNEAEARGE